MKIAILAAGIPKGFPLLFRKPKCLYHFRNEIQLERVIKVARKFVDEKDIIIVGGYNANLIKKHLLINHPEIEFRVNHNYKQSAVYSLRKAVENIDESVVFMLADENILEKNVKKICDSQRKMAILCEDKYHYYCVGIMKLDSESIKLIEDDCYLSMDYLKNVYFFVEGKNDSSFRISSGVGLGYTTIDLVRRIGNIQKLENPMTTYHGEEIDFIPYDWRNEYTKDVDSFEDTDEYFKNGFMRWYYDNVYLNVRTIGRRIKHLL